MQGKCETCGLYSRPGEFGLECIADGCIENEILKTDGTCVECEDYFHPDSENKNCVQEVCNTVRDIWLVSGNCKSCEAYTYPDAANRECIADTCDTTSQWLQANGTCFTCGENESPNSNGNGCEGHDEDWDGIGIHNHTRWMRIK